MRAPTRTVLDHLITWVAAILVGSYGLISFVGLLAPQPPDAIHDGFMGLIIFPAIASLYGAAAILQQDYMIVARWRPSIRGALTLSWVGGWLLLVGLAVIGDLISRGPVSARETLVYGLLFLALFVGLPWTLARLRRRRMDGGRAFLEP